MKNESKIKILLGLVIVLAFFLITSDEKKINSVDYENDDLNLSDYWDLSGSPILIDNSDPSKDWAYTAFNYDWCTGSGTVEDPYIIANVTINGQNLGNCITIQNSNVFFIIRNCTLYNSTGGYWDGGIKLKNVRNGQLIDNDCSENAGNGIYIESSNFNTISGNILSNNVRMGVRLRYSHQNVISDNTVESNDRGIYISESDDNIVSDNYISKNGHGIYSSWGSERSHYINNIIYDNLGAVTLTHEFHLGCDYNVISGNIIDSNTFGLWITESHNIQIENNHFINMNAWGISLSRSLDTKIISNVFKNHMAYGSIAVDIMDSNYTISYLNNFTNNNIHVTDDGNFNSWDDGTIGNYWDDYPGVDYNDDGIGDTPYLISGTAGSQDNFPIWDDGFTPIANDDIYSVDEDNELTISAPGVMDNDFDGDGDLISAILVSDVTNGTLTFNPDGSFTYQPDTDFYGVDVFKYIVNDGLLDSPIANVEIVVNPVNDAPPVAVDDTATTDEDIAVIIDVLANDDDIDGDPLEVSSYTQPSNGTLALNVGIFTYTPDQHYYGSDSFIYTISDGMGGFDTAIVSITINPINDVPLAINYSYSVDEDGELIVSAPGLLAFTIDFDDDPLSIILVSDVSHGTLTLNSDGTFIYIPDPDYQGTDLFKYKANDGLADSNVGWVGIWINNVNDPPVAVDDAATTDEDVAVIIDVLTNDYDIDGDTLNIVNILNIIGGVAIDNGDGTITFTPTLDFIGTASFNYTISDMLGGTDTAQCTITVIDNTPPESVIYVDGMLPLNGWFSSDGLISFTATDNYAGVSFIEYSFDGGGTWEIYITPFEGALHGVEIWYRAWDNAGNDEPINIYVFQIDKTPPTTTASLSGDLGENGWYTSDVTITLTAADADSGINFTAYSYDNVIWETYETSILIQSEGITTIYYRSTDNAGWVEAVNSIEVKIDKTLPTVIPTLIGDLCENGWYRSDVTVSLTGFDAISGVDTILCDIKYVPPIGIPSIEVPVPPKIYTGPFTITAEGYRIIRVWVNDTAGHLYDMSIHVKIDKTPPITTAMLSGNLGENGWYISDVTVTLVATDDFSGVNYNSGLNFTEYSYDNVIWVTYISPFTVQTEGITTIYYRSIDNASWVEDANTIEVKIDKTLPTATYTLTGDLGENGWYMSDVLVTLDASDAVSGADCILYDYIYVGPLPGDYKMTPFPSLVYTEPFTMVWEGEFRIRVWVNDTAGQVHTMYFKVDIDKTLPITTASLSGNMGENEWYTSDVIVTLEASDAISGVNSTEYSYDNELWVSYVSPLTIQTEGITNVYFRSIDNASWVEIVNSIEVKIDKTLPTVIPTLIGDLCESGWYRSDVTVSFTGFDDISGVDTIVYKIKYVDPLGLPSIEVPTPPTIYTGPFTITAEGYRRIRVWVNDTAGKVYDMSINVKIDKTPPITEATLSGNLGENGWYISDVTVTLVATDDFSGVNFVSGVNFTEYSYDNVIWETYVTPLTVLSEGITTIYFRSIDNASWVETVNILEVKIDKSLPTATPTLTGILGENGWYTSDVTISLTASDAISDVDYILYDYTYIGPFQGPAVIRFPLIPSLVYEEPFTIVWEGQFLIRVWVNDTAGHIYTMDFEVDIDKTPPTTTATLEGILGENGWYTSDVNVALTATDDYSGVNFTEYSYDNVIWETYVTPLTVQAEGVTTIYYRSTDNASWVEPVNIIEVKIDKTLPTVIPTLIGDLCENGWYRSDVTVSLTGFDDISGVDTILYRIKTVPPIGIPTIEEPVPPKIYTGPFTITAEGYRIIRVWVNDTTGHIYDMSIHVKIDKTSPITTVSLSGNLGENGWYISDVTVTLVATDDFPGVNYFSGVNFTEYSYDNEIWETYVSPLSIQTEGITTVYFRSTDNVGWIETLNSIEVKIDKALPTATPTLTGVLGENGWYISDVTVTLDASDSISGVDCILYRIVHVGPFSGPVKTLPTPPTIYTEPFTIEWEGLRMVYVWVNDTAGNLYEMEIEVNIDKTPPITTAALSGNLGEYNWYRSDVTVSLAATDDFSGVNFTEYSYDNVIWVTYVSPFTIQTEGITTIYYRSIDNASWVEDTNSIEVNIDKTSPTATYQLTGDLGWNGWYVYDVTVEITAFDTFSGIDYIFYDIDYMGPIVIPGIEELTPPTYYTEPFTITMQGQWIIRVYVFDRADHFYYMEIEVNIDKLPPITEATLFGDFSSQNGWYRSDVTVTLAIFDDFSGLNFTEYSYDNEIWQIYSSPLTIQSEGFTTIYYRSTDNAGWVEPINSIEVKIDKTPPTATYNLIGDSGEDGWYRSDVTVNISSYDAVSGVDYILITDTLYTGPFNITMEGQTIIEVYVIDRAEQLYSMQIEINIDKTLPTTTATLGGDLGEYGWYRSDVIVTLTATDALSGVIFTEYSYDNEIWQTYLSPLIIQSEGFTNIYYKSIDNAGNCEDIKVESFKISIAGITIDDTGDGDYTWAELSATRWCSGSGTWNDPYIIEELILDCQNIESCITIRNSAVPFIIRNCEIINSAKGGFPDYFAGIKLINVEYGTIEGCIIRSNEIGIYLIESDYNLITDNLIEANKGFGISLKYSNNNEISWNQASNNQGSGIDLGSYGTCHYNEIIGNIANNNGGYRGLKLFGNYNNVSYNTFNNNYIGITSEGRSNIFKGNDISDNAQYGMQISRSRELRILNSSINNTFQSYGIYFWKCQDCIIEGNELLNNNGAILFGDECFNNIISNNDIINNGIGIKINGNSDYNIIYNNEFIGNTLNAEDNGYALTPISYQRDYANQILDKRGLLWGTAFPRVVGDNSLIASALSTKDNWNLFLEADYPYYCSWNGWFWESAPNWVWLRWGNYANFESDTHQYLSSIQIHYRIMAEGGWKPFNNLDQAKFLILRIYDDAGNYQDLEVANTPEDKVYYDTSINKVPWLINSGPVFDRVKQGGYIKSCAVLMYCSEPFGTIVWLNIDFLEIVYYTSIRLSSNNQWDNGTIGNYWDDYLGVDYNDDGIGDSPYIISGTAENQDNFPIWDDGATPVANDDFFFIDEDCTLMIFTPGVMGNDFDADEDLSYVSVDIGPLYGTLTLNTDGSFTYVPDENYHGVDTFTYVVYDTVGAYDYGTVLITINAVNDVPLAYDASYLTNEDEVLNIPIPGILDNVYDVDGDQLNTILVTDVIYGTLTLNTDGSFLYTPDANFHGEDWFEYKVNDGSVDSNVATVTITIVSVNDAPVANGDSATTNEDVPINIDVLANDYDVDGDSLYIVNILAMPGHEVIDNGDGTVTYTPALDFVGVAFFNYTISDGQGGISSAICSVIVLDTTPPETLIDYIGTSHYIAHLEEYWYYQDVLIELFANDAGVGVSYTEYSFNNIDWIIYTEPFNVPFEGESTIYYRSSDNYGNLEETLISTINIIYSPFVIDDEGGGDYTWFEALAQPWCSGSGTETDPYIIEYMVIIGDVFIESCIEIFNSDVYFILRNNTLIDGKTGVLLQNVNNSILRNNYLGRNLDGIRLENSLWNNITENYIVDSKNVGIYLISSNNNTISNCTLCANLYGIKLENSHSNKICYNYLKNNKHGIDMVNSYYNVIHDNIIKSILIREIIAIRDEGCSNHIYRNIVSGYNTAVELYEARDNRVLMNTITECEIGVSLESSIHNVIEGNTFSNNLDYAVKITGGDSNYNLVVKNEFIDNNGGNVQAYDDSGLNSWSDENGIGNYWSDYEERYPDSGGEDNTWDSAYEIDGPVEVVDDGCLINPAPVAVDDIYSVLEDNVLTVVAPGVMENDYDSEGDLSYVILDVGPLHGILTLNSDGSFTYVPEADYNGDDTFIYIVYDTSGAYDYGTALITIIAVNDAPLAYDASYSTNEDEVLNLPVPGILTNVYDVDGDLLNVILVTDVMDGTLILNPDGSLLYIPDANYYGDIWFEYKVNDGSVDSNTAVITITVISVNDAPVAVSSTVTTLEDTYISIILFATDIEEDLLAFIIVDYPSYGGLSGVGSNIIYMPDPNYWGTDFFTFKVNDGALDSNIATITITIHPVNDAPIANSDSAITDEGTSVIIEVLANDSDVDGDSLSIEEVTVPAWGTAVISGDVIVYTPYMDYSGEVSFMYTISDGNGGFDTATVIVTVIDKTAPTTTITIQGSYHGIDPTYVSNATKFILEATDNPLGSGIDRIEYRIDSGGWNTYDIPFNLMYKGSYIIYYRSVDKAGNEEAEHSLWVIVNAVNITYTGEIQGTYSDLVFVEAKLIEMATQLPIPGKTIEFTIGSQTDFAETLSDGVAHLNIILNQPYGYYSVSASFAGDKMYLSDSDSKEFIIEKENVYLTYTGSTVVPTTVETITLRATVFDEDDGYWGDLTKIYVTFNIYSCPIPDPPLPLVSYGPYMIEVTVVDGVGVFIIEVPNLNENGYLVQVILSPSENHYYQAIASDLVTLTVYEPTGDFVTGGGWIWNPTGSKGNFGFNVKYKKNGLPKGQAIYVYREGDWEYIIKSNAWEGMAIIDNHSFFEAKCVVQQYNSKTGELYWSEGNYRMRIDVWDEDKDGGVDVFQIRVYDKIGLVYHEAGFDPLGILEGGNIVIHIDEEK
ncbi:MAG: OmpL47-type beta-barrel domain-containing protein [Candidatus Hermodarchaeota archaeon]